MSRVNTPVTRAQQRDATPPLISFRHFEINCPSRDVFGLLFPVSYPVSILWCRLPCGQYARNSKTPQWSWHVKILSYAHAFTINWQFCPAVGEGIEFPPPPRLILHSQEWVWGVNSCSYQELESGISHVWFSSLRDLEAAQMWGGNTPPAHYLWLRAGQIS